jgi:serine/threonine protein kinase
MAEGHGQLIAGRYRLARPLGRGGMGVVWRARDEFLRRDVAVKEVVFPAGIPAAEQRLACARGIQEARAAARLIHPCVITVHDVVEYDGRPWIVMELFPGPSLADVIDREGPLSPRRVAEIGVRVLAALGAAHSAGIVHRDVKPANVLVDGDRVVLTDFGAAAIRADPALTGTGQFIGTPAYLAPERAREVRDSPASDLWSLGATLYEAVEGRPPYAGTDFLAVLSALLTSDPPAPRRAGPLGQVLAGLMCRDMADRLTLAKAREMLTALAAPAPGPARSPTMPVTGAREWSSSLTSNDPATVTSRGPDSSAPAAGRRHHAAGQPNAPASPPALPKPRPDGPPPPGRRRHLVALLLVAALCAGAGGLIYFNMKPNPVDSPGNPVTPHGAHPVSYIRGVKIVGFSLVCDPEINTPDNQGCGPPVRQLQGGENGSIYLAFRGMSRSGLNRLCSLGYRSWLSENQYSQPSVTDQLQYPGPDTPAKYTQRTANGQYVKVGPGAHVPGSQGDVCHDINLSESPDYVSINVNKAFVATGLLAITWRLYNPSGKVLLSTTYHVMVAK